MLNCLFKRFISVKKQIALLKSQRKPVVIDPQDIVEQRVRGSGPGGQCVNTASNKVRLMHQPTGLVVESHRTREVHINRKDAMSKLKALLDERINGEGSTENLKMMLIKERKRKQQKEARKKHQQPPIGTNPTTTENKQE